MIIKNKYATFVGHKFLGKFYHVVQKWTAPDAPGADDVLSATTLGTAAQTITSGITQPDFARVLSITGVMAGGSLTGNVVITGKNIREETITETIALNDNGTVAGTKAFKYVSSIALPARVTASDTVSVGITDKLGLQAVPWSTSVEMEHSNHTADTGGAVLARNATDISKCLYDPTTECNASAGKMISYLSEDTHAKISAYTE
jgi:hypothetical protein